MNYEEAIAKAKHPSGRLLLTLWQLVGFSEPLPRELVILAVEQPDKHPDSLAYAIKRARECLEDLGPCGALNRAGWALLLASASPEIREVAIRLSARPDLWVE